MRISFLSNNTLRVLVESGAFDNTNGDYNIEESGYLYFESRLADWSLDGLVMVGSIFWKSFFNYYNS